MAKTTLALLLLLTLPTTAAPPVNRGKILDREGSVLAHVEKGQRTYPFGAIASHTLGYVSRIRAGDDKVEGRDGVERTADAKLRDGDLRLTLDLRKQFVAERALRDAGITRGSVVVLDPANGDVIAMASVASYDPNSFVPAISQADYKRYIENDKRPLLGRCTNGSYPPGSAIKPIVALAVSDPTAKVVCTGATQVGNAMMKCWKQEGHGKVDLPAAIAQSCNCYFYETGTAAGLDRLHALATRFGLSAETGIELVGEQDGIIPDEAHIKKVFPGQPNGVNAAMLAIGQSLANVTPLQMAVVAATFANGGQRPAPRLFLDREPIALTDVDGFDEDVFTTVRESLRAVVNDHSGTGRRAMGARLTIAGKTGTAQRGREDYIGWFIGFAPFEKPRYAIAIAVENAESGGKTCAPLAKSILEGCAAIDAGEEIEVTQLPPVE